MATFREAVAGEVRAHLARRRMTALDLGRKLGWSQSYMSRRISGRVGYSVDDLDEIAGALGVPVIELLPASIREVSESHTVGYAARAREVTVRPIDNRPNGRVTGHSTIRPGSTPRRVARLRRPA